MRPVVIVVRDPDYSNAFTTFPGDGEPWVIDVDLGAGDLSDEEELQDFLGGFEHTLDSLEVNGYSDAATALRAILEDVDQ